MRLASLAKASTGENCRYQGFNYDKYTDTKEKRQNVKKKYRGQSDRCARARAIGGLPQIARFVRSSPYFVMYLSHRVVFQSRSAPKVRYWSKITCI